jgi:aminopeptidase N
VTLGEQIQETPDGSGLATEWRMDTPIPFFKFAIGDYKRYDTTGKTAQRTVPVQFYGIQNGVKTDFVAAEMANALQYYSLLYGPFPYSGLHAVYNYRAYGQGMATMLLLAGADQSERYTYSFISHEVAHQWWGDMVAWRSYRDQWLSEGFAEYSSFLYTGQRDSGKARQELIDVNRDKLRATVVFPGIGSMRVADIGPLILGHRLGSGYYPLTYEKGALVLRMLHFLFTDPATLDDKPFFEMMAAFVKDHNGGAASTEDFIASANQRFAETAIAKKYRLADLNWFFQEWVYAAELPSYRFVYQLKPQPDGSTLLTGTLFQDGLAAGDKWFMPLPLVMTYGKDKVARGTGAVLGPQTPINIKLPSMPEKVELDPDMFVLSLKTSAVKEH